MQIINHDFVFQKMGRMDHLISCDCPHWLFPPIEIHTWDLLLLPARSHAHMLCVNDPWASGEHTAHMPGTEQGAHLLSLIGRIQGDGNSLLQGANTKKLNNATAEQSLSNEYEEIG